MLYLELVTLETLITLLQEKDVNDFLTSLSVFVDGAIELYIPWKLFRRRNFGQLLNKGWIDAMGIEYKKQWWILKYQTLQNKHYVYWIKRFTHLLVLSLLQSRKMIISNLSRYKNLL